MEEHAGTMFDPDIVRPFTAMIRKNEAEVSVVTGEDMSVVPVVPAAENVDRPGES
jgi:hypothetical protein